MWLQRRRFGMVRPLRLVAVASVIVYTMTLAGLTVAPAYDVAVTCRNRVGGVLRADPFHTVAETLEIGRASCRERVGTAGAARGRWQAASRAKGARVVRE